MITITFRWDDDGKCLEQRIKKFKRLLSKALKNNSTESEAVFFGTLEGNLSPNREDLIPPHYHVLSNICLTADEEAVLRSQVEVLGFGFKYVEDLSEDADLRFCKYVLKKDKNGWSVKPKFLPNRWCGCNIPATFKSGGFLNFKIEETTTMDTSSCIERSARQVHFRRQFPLKTSPIINNPVKDGGKNNSSSDGCCYDLKDLKLECSGTDHSPFFSMPDPSRMSFARQFLQERYRPP